MADTGKIKPEFTSRGVFLPWTGLLSAIFGLLLILIIPLWTFTVKAMFVADKIESIQDSDREQSITLQRHGEELAVLKAKSKP